MPKKPNYNFEKQQREQARERKRNAKAEEKRLRKLAERQGTEGDAAPPTDVDGGADERGGR